MPGQPLHVLQRGNNRQSVFFAEADYRRYLEALTDGSARYGCRVHAYVLMTNHVHILVTPEVEHSVSRMMQSVGRRYVRYVNDTHCRTGTLWEGRFKCSLVDTQAYLMRCYVYIEMNPVRAGMVAAPQNYKWSSHRGNALGRSDPVLTPHELYHELGTDGDTRRQTYRALFTGDPERRSTDDIRDAAENELPLGNERFRGQIERTTNRRVRRHSHGGDRRSQSFLRSLRGRSS